MPLEPIPPPDKVTGQSVLPVSRVKRIINADVDVDKCSNNAAFVISVAAEMFVQYLAEQGHTVVKSERKPRRNIQYKDLATVVARVDNLEFLSGVVPRTVPYKQYKEKKAKEEAAKAKGQQGGGTLIDESESGGVVGLPIRNTHQETRKSLDGSKPQATNGHAADEDSEDHAMS